MEQYKGIIWPNSTDSVKRTMERYKGILWPNSRYVCVRAYVRACVRVCVCALSWSFQWCRAVCAGIEKLGIKRLELTSKLRSRFMQFFLTFVMSTYQNQQCGLAAQGKCG